LPLRPALLLLALGILSVGDFLQFLLELQARVCPTTRAAGGLSRFSPLDCWRRALLRSARSVDSSARFVDNRLGSRGPSIYWQLRIRGVLDCLLGGRSLRFIGHVDLHCCALLDW